MQTLQLPRLVGSRESAVALASSLPSRLVGEQVVVVSRDLVSGSPSFADELVVELLARRQADRVVVVGAYDDFAAYVTDSAARHDVAHRLDLRPAGSEVGARPRG